MSALSTVEADKVPIVTANSKPFRLIQRSEFDLWETDLEQVNSSSYDYVKLHRLSTYVDVGILPFSMGVCFDGTLILPAIKKYEDRSSALAKFNETLAQLLIGGLYCEAAEPDDIGYGSLTLDGYSKVYGVGKGSSSAFHAGARMKMLGSIDRIALFDPEKITVSDFEKALSRGRDLLSQLGPVPYEQILYGSTFYARNQWPESLLHYWTSIERLIEVSWNKYVINHPSKPSKKRKSFLDDNRLWTMSAKLEVLLQKNILPLDVYDNLGDIRRSGNNFVHSAQMPGHAVAKQALGAFFELSSLCASDFKERGLFDEVSKVIESRGNPNVYPTRARFEASEVRHWIAIPPIPGDINWGDEPYEVIEGLRLRPLDNIE